MTQTETRVIAPNEGTAFELQAQERFRITDLQGHQVSDMVVFSARDHKDRFSPGNTRKLNNSLLLTTGSTLYSTRCSPLLHIVDDSVGRHDLTSSWCNPYDYPIRFGITDHPSCLAILIEALKPHGIAEAAIPEPFNVFMMTNIDGATGRIEVMESPSPPGGYAEFEADQDCLIAMTACPQDQNACNGWKITPLQVDIAHHSAG